MSTRIRGLLDAPPWGTAGASRLPKCVALREQVKRTGRGRLSGKKSQTRDFLSQQGHRVLIIPFCTNCLYLYLFPPAGGDSGRNGGLDALGERDRDKERSEDRSARDRFLEPVDVERQGVLNLREYRTRTSISTPQRL